MADLIKRDLSMSIKFSILMAKLTSSAIMFVYRFKPISIIKYLSFLKVFKVFDADSNGEIVS